MWLNEHAKVLVVDDEPFMLKLLSHQLKVLGFSNVSTCDSGYVALKLIDGSSAAGDLILCDLNMPEMDGVEFVRHLVGTGYAGGLILVSGVEERILQAAERLVNAHGITLLGRLHKPVASDALRDLLAKWPPPLTQAVRAARTVYSASEIRAAIANNELVNHYQPKVALASGAVLGVEALVRWNHPVDGLAFPDQFIAEAEARGLIGDLTRVVLESALLDLRDWQRSGLELKLAVNVSMNNLDALDFPDVVAQLVAQAGVAPQDVVLEVTESRLMNDLRAVLEIVTRLAMKGFGLSIDDFGTGHSSLAQLRDLPFNELKIDRSFVHGAWANKTTQAIYSSSLTMATQLGMEVVAEGVEDRSDWDYLCRSGCHVAQGYFIARPMPADALHQWMAEWRERLRSERPALLADGE